MAHHLAQLNIAYMKAPLDDPLMKRFVESLEPMSALADGSSVFIWRLKSDQRDATSIIGPFGSECEPATLFPRGMSSPS